MTYSMLMCKVLQVSISGTGIYDKVDFVFLSMIIFVFGCFAMLSQCCKLLYELQLLLQ